MIQPTGKKISEFDANEGIANFLIRESTFPILRIQAETGSIQAANSAFFRYYEYQETEFDLTYYELISKKPKNGNGTKSWKRQLGQNGIKNHYNSSEKEFKVLEQWLSWPEDPSIWMLHLQPFLEEKSDKEHLKEKEKQFEILANTSYDIIWKTDLNLRFTYVTPSVKKLAGYTPEEFIGTRLSEHCSPTEFRRMARIALQNLLNFRYSTGVRMESVTFRKDGSRMPVEVIGQLSFNRWGIPIGFHGTTRDITERIRAREEVQNEKLLLQTLIDNLPDRIYFKDRQSKFIFANKAVADHIGVRDTRELLNKTDLDYYPQEHANRYYSDEQNIMMTGNPLINYEEPARNPDKTVGWTLSSKIPIKNAEGKVIGLVGISRDITGIKQSQIELLAAKEKAELSNRLKDSFIANVSHEIRTPLNAILGFSALIRDEYEESGSIESMDYFSIVETSGDRLMRTIEMILNLSRIETGEYTVLPRELDLQVILERLKNDYQLTARKKNLELSFEIHTSRKTICCDEYAFEHSLSNLIDNAIKYTHAGFVKVRFSDNPDQGLKIEVQDSGIGISKEYLPYLFEPYSQEEDGYARTFEGIGLGLSLTHKLIKLIDGTITVQSQKGEGTTFTLTLSDQTPS